MRGTSDRTPNLAGFQTDLFAGAASAWSGCARKGKGGPLTTIDQPASEHVFVAALDLPAGQIFLVKRPRKYDSRACRQWSVPKNEQQRFCRESCRKRATRRSRHRQLH